MLYFFSNLLLFLGLFSTTVFSQHNSDIFAGFSTNQSIHSISLDLILDGGPPKDGIPALFNPQFSTVNDVDLADDMRGMFIDFDGDRRFYPYNILVWHEIVNDKVQGKHIAVTFCPLCGSAILFDREVNGTINEFGVTGLLYQSNMLMYDKKTESFWSQSLRKAVVGDYTDQELEILPFQLITFGEVKQRYPDTKVLNEDTGYRRNYSRYPYGDYEDNPLLVFPVVKEDNRYHPKKMVYVFDIDDKTVALDPDVFSKERAHTRINEQEISAEKNGNEITVSVNGEHVAGYWEMWFSWFVHHAEEGIVWDDK